MRPKQWPPNGALVDVEVAISHLAVSFMRTHRIITPIQGRKPVYHGYGFGRDTAAVARYPWEQKHLDPATAWLLFAFQLGIEQGRRLVERDPTAVAALLDKDHLAAAIAERRARRERARTVVGYRIRVQTPEGHRYYNGSPDKAPTKVGTPRPEPIPTREEAKERLAGWTARPIGCPVFIVKVTRRVAQRPGTSPNDLLQRATRFSWHPGDQRRELHLEAVQQRDGSALWAIRRFGECWTRKGEWEYEPMPSSRDDAFLARARWSFEEAWREAERLAAETATP